MTLTAAARIDCIADLHAWQAFIGLHSDKRDNAYDFTPNNAGICDPWSPVGVVF